MILTSKGWCDTELIGGLVQLLSDLRCIGLVLANHGLLGAHGLQMAEDLELVAEDLLRAAENLGHLHGQQGHDLSEMVLHHISDHPVLVVERNPTFGDKQKNGIKYTFLVKNFVCLVSLRQCGLF